MNRGKSIDHTLDQDLSFIYTNAIRIRYFYVILKVSNVCQNMSKCIETY